jgi:hypothetical protein
LLLISCNIYPLPKPNDVSIKPLGRNLAIQKTKLPLLLAQYPPNKIFPLESIVIEAAVVIGRNTFDYISISRSKACIECTVRINSNHTKIHVRYVATRTTHDDLSKILYCERRTITIDTIKIKSKFTIVSKGIV